MSTIKVNPDKLEEVADRLTTLAEEMGEQNGKLEEIETTVEAAWKSNYTGLYLNELGVVKRNIEVLRDETGKIARALRQTANKVRQAEEENSRHFHGSGGGGGGFR